MKQSTKIALIMGLICFLLSAGIAVQVRSMVGTTTVVGESQTTNQLRDSVLEWREKYEQAIDKLEYKEAELDSIRKKISSENQDAGDITSIIADNNEALGLTEVNGQGVTIVCKDGEVSSSSILTSQYLVHDGDLLNLINALKNAGAEAISVNEQRIVNKTSVYCSGNIIMINNQGFNIKPISIEINEEIERFLIDKYKLSPNEIIYLIYSIINNPKMATIDYIHLSNYEFGFINIKIN